MDLERLSIEEMRRLRNEDAGAGVEEKPTTAEDDLVGTAGATMDTEEEPKADEDEPLGSEEETLDDEEESKDDEDEPASWVENVGPEDGALAAPAPAPSDEPEFLRVSLPMALCRTLLEKAGIDGEPTESDVIAVLEQWV